MLLFLIDLINIEKFRISFRFFYSFFFIFRSRATSVWYRSTKAIRQHLFCRPNNDATDRPRYRHRPHPGRRSVQHAGLPIPCDAPVFLSSEFSFVFSGKEPNQPISIAKSRPPPPTRRTTNFSLEIKSNSTIFQLRTLQLLGSIYCLPIQAL